MVLQRIDAQDKFAFDDSHPDNETLKPMIFDKGRVETNNDHDSHGEVLD